MKILDFPDSGLKEIDPRQLINAVQKEVHVINPHVLVSYPVHGISGFEDHLVTHAVVKHAYLELKEKEGLSLKRLAFFTLGPEYAKENENNPFDLKRSSNDYIDCILEFDKEDIQSMERSLQCFETYQEVIEKTGVMKDIADFGCFEFFQEHYDPPVKDLFQDL